MAVDVLVTRNSAPDNPAHDDAGKWARWLPVDVREVGHVTAHERTVFYVLTITDPSLTVAQVKSRLLDRDMDDSNPDEDGTGTPRYVRAWKFLVSNLPAGVRNQILTTGAYSTTLANIRNFIQQRRTGETY